mgnify:FL=1
MKKTYTNIFLYLIILFSIYTAVTIGFSWDEGAVITMAKLRLKYLFSFGSSAYEPLWFSKFYPGTYSVIAIFITQLFHKSYELEILHILNSVMGISTIFGISKIARELFNKKIGYIVFVVSFFNPVFFGHMSMNERDLVIAFCNVWITYGLIKYLKNHHIKEKRKKLVIILGFLLGLGSSCRVSFAATLVPVFIFFIVDILNQKKLSIKKINIYFFLKDLFISLLIAYFVLIIFWPEVYPNIFTLPFTFFIESLNLAFGVGNGIINGEIFYTNSPPKNYILVLLFHKVPEYIIFCYLLFVFFILNKSVFFKNNFSNFYYKLILIISILAFPNLLLIVSPFPAYDNLRLFLFLIPYIALLPGLAIYYMLENLKLNLNKILGSIIALLFVYNLYSFFALTPYQYTYLNFFNGKFSESYNKFESDYWATSIKELIKKTDFKRDEQIKLAICGLPRARTKYYLKKFNFKNISVVTPDEEYDYIMMSNRIYTIGETTQSCFDHYPGKIFSSVKRRGLILSLIKKNII